MKKSQGEIFGIALMFVIIIVGFIIFAKIKSMNPDNSGDSLTEGKYKILAEGSLNTILELSTGCFVERNKDSLKDLVNYCIENTYSSDDDPYIECDSFNDNFGSCTRAINILNNSLKQIFNTSNGIGPLPYMLKISLPSQSENKLNTKISNFGDFSYNDIIINESNYRKKGYKRAPSGLRNWATSKRGVKFELYLYYR